MDILNLILKVEEKNPLDISDLNSATLTLHLVFFAMQTHLLKVSLS